MAKKTIFVVDSPLDYRVKLSRNRWREIVRYKHPALEGLEKEVRECIQEPFVIRESQKDADVHLYYRECENGYLCVVVGRNEDLEGFVITAYFTDSLKKGRELWTK
jgi:hypothetical protein